MSAYETKDGSGALFKNAERESEQQPDYRGNIKLGGTEYWLSAWIKTSKNGAKYMSLSGQPKLAKQIPGAVANKRRDDLDDPLPF